MIKKYETLDGWERTSFVKDVKTGNICIMGWVDHIKEIEGKWRISIRDKTGVGTFLVENKFTKNIKKLQKITQESVIALKGQLRHDLFGLDEEGVKIFNLAKSPYPYKKDQLDLSSIDLLPKRQFVIRSLEMKNILKLRSDILNAIREFMKKEDVTEFSSQTIALATDPGVRTANLFTLPHYKVSPYVLSSSAQLYKQAALLPLDKVYTISPALRAEQTESKLTGRHLSDFWELDFEQAFINYNKVMAFAERMLKYIVDSIIKNNKRELRDLKVSLKPFKIPFKKISHNKAIELARKEGVSTPKDEEISWEAEKVISKKFDHPFWIIDYPTKARAWYYRRDLNNPKIVKTMDLLYPKGFGEGITGGEREYDYYTLIERIKETGENPKKYLWYLDMFKYGMAPSAGFGLGIERLIKFLANRKYIWETNMFPRVPGIISP